MTLNFRHKTNRDEDCDGQEFTIVDYSEYHFMCDKCGINLIANDIMGHSLNEIAIMIRRLSNS